MTRTHRAKPYLQYFIGMKEYETCPFGASTLAVLRKRFGEEDMAVILEASIPKPEEQEKDHSNDKDDLPNSGTLILDAACCPAGIAYPKHRAIMFESKTHTIPRRIVSLAQPWVQPIVRGKAHANTEFGAKLHISLVNSYTRIEWLDCKEHGIRLSGPSLGKPPKDQKLPCQAKEAGASR